MAGSSQLRHGQIYWLDECPALDGSIAKRRPVIVVTPTKVIDAGADPIEIVATTTGEPTDEDRVLIPGQDVDAETPTGLPQTSWALPRWLLRVHRSNLREYVGRISLAKLDYLWEQIEARSGLGEESPE